MEDVTDFKSFHSNASSSLVSTTRTTNQLCAEDLAFHRSLDPRLGALLDGQNARLLALTERLLSNAAQGSEVPAPQVPDTDSIESNWRTIVEVVDNLLEKADSSIDEYTGVIKRLSPATEDTKPKHNDSKLQKSLRSRDMAKPQKLFENIPQNDESGPFKPLLLSKPHATSSLDESLDLAPNEEGWKQYLHPYRDEIESYDYPPSVYREAEPTPYTPFDTTSATMVETEEDVELMLQELKGSTEIAIDLEHHDYRSYMGVVSLMQISTRTSDWIVDTLKPWRRKLECLNEVFADPKIVKVLHGAYMDIIWLQRDLGLYVVGLFDTYFAARSLRYAGAGLAFLLDKFVGFKAEKKYQMADWRIRPLPAEMFKYARSDTHFLLYIYDCMRNELVQNSDSSLNRVKWVLEKSKEVALQTYEYPVYDKDAGSGPMGWMKLIYRSPAMFSKEQFSVFRALHQWRDKTAREEDESPVYVLSNHALFSISRAMPGEKASLLSVSNPASPLLRRHASEVVALIANAKSAAQGDPDVSTFLAQLSHTEETISVGVGIASVATRTPNGTSGPNTPFLKNLLRSRSIMSDFWRGLVNNRGSREEFPSQSNKSLTIGFSPSTAQTFPVLNSRIGDEELEMTADRTASDSREGTGKNKEDNIFILRELNKKRKLAEVDMTRPGELESAEAEDGTISLTDEAQERLRLKAQLKSEKKAARKARKKETKASLTPGDATSEPTDEPFDYNGAPNLLRSHNQTSNTSQGANRTKAFNPFKKALDTSKGLARSQRERAGRSATFK